MNETAAPPLRAGIYGRASSDPKKRGRSVADQMTDNRRVCAERGWTVVEEYIDLDRSASRHAKRAREDYDRLGRDIEAKKIDVLVAWEPSRLQRDTTAYTRLRDMCEKAGVWWCCNGTLYDMRDGADRVTTIILAAMAEKEADDIQRRNARTTRLAAARGAPHGRIPFGYLRRYDPLDGHLVGQFPHSKLAPVVRQAFKRAAARESLDSIARFLEPQLPNVTVAGVRYLLKNRAYIGLRTSRGQDVKAQWDPIVKEGVFWRVQEILAEPERRTSRDTRAVYLLSGIVECGVCEPAAQVGLKGVPPGYHPRLRYTCRSKGHVSVDLERLDAYVEEAVLRWLASPAAQVAFEPPQDGAMEAERSKLAALRAQLGEARTLAGQFDPVTYAPKLSAASLATLEAGLLPMMAEAEARLRHLAAIGDPVVDRLLGAPPEMLQETWDDLVIEQKRHALRRLVRVTLMRAARQGARELNAERVRIAFAGGDGFEPQDRRTRGLAAVSG